MYNLLIFFIKEYLCSHYKTKCGNMKCKDCIYYLYEKYTKNNNYIKLIYTCYYKFFI